jgi:hypothetical protein
MSRKILDRVGGGVVCASAVAIPLYNKVQSKVNLIIFEKLFRQKYNDYAGNMMFVSFQRAIYNENLQALKVSSLFNNNKVRDVCYTICNPSTNARSTWLTTIASEVFSKPNLF